MLIAVVCMAGLPVLASPQMPDSESEPADWAESTLYLGDNEAALEIDSLGDLSLEELLQIRVVSATKLEQSSADIPAIVSVVTAEDIQRRGYRTVAEALAHLPGLVSIDTHLYQYIGVRGIFGSSESPNDIIKVMINGQPIMFRSTALSFFAGDLLPIEAVRQIEIIRGPSSALYGANAFLGVINVITYDGTEGTEDRPHHLLTGDLFVSGDLTHKARFNGAGSVVSGERLADFNYLIGVTYRATNRSGLAAPIGVGSLTPSPGWDPGTRTYIRNQGRTSRDTGDTFSAYGLAGYNLLPHLRLESDGHLQFNDIAGEFEQYSQLTHQTHLAHLNGYGRLRLLLNKEAATGLSASLSATLASGRTLGRERIRDRLLEGIYKRRIMGYSALDTQAEVTWKLNDSDVLIVGIDYTYESHDLLSLEVVDDRGSVLGEEPGFDDISVHQLGTYAQLLWNPLAKLNLTLGVRGDHNSSVACSTPQWSCLGELDSKVVNVSGVAGLNSNVLVENRGIIQLSTRAAAVYAFPFLDSYAKALYGSSFKPPSTYQLYHGQLTINGSSVGNPALKPQTANTIELQVGFRPLTGLRAEITGFYTHVKDMVIFLKDRGVLSGRNANQTSAGSELTVDFVWKRKLRGFWNVTLILHNKIEPQRRVDETDTLWQYSPLNETIAGGRFADFFTAFGIDYGFDMLPLKLNVTGRLVGPRRASIINNQLYNAQDLNKTYELGPYFAASATLSLLSGKRQVSPLGDMVLSLTLRGVFGDAVEPGLGGLDIPLPTAQAFLRVEQRF